MRNLLKILKILAIIVILQSCVDYTGDTYNIVLPSGDTITNVESDIIDEERIDDIIEMYNDTVNLSEEEVLRNENEKLKKELEKYK